MAGDEQRLTRRERQILDILYRLEKATALEILEQLPDPPTYSTVRKLLSLLEEKGLIHHRERGRRYVYLPVKSKTDARTRALKHIVETFFENSAEGAITALLGMSAAKMSEEDFKRLTNMIERKRKEHS
ncbi:MAG: BlaI/MecI/CopY family transcriptional regulator [candidate division Zixibacteria bacterium]|nr:BlaI/MecI/CopY family transcriptional regulator [candidate division Zixibacteria bacterium]